MTMLQRSITALCFLYVLLTGTPLSAASPTAASQQVTLDIPATSVEEALKAFARQAGVQVLFYSAIVERMNAPKLTGEFTPDAALNTLLAGTGLRHEFINDRTVAIRIAKPQAPGKPQAQSRQGAGSEAPERGVMRLARAEVEAVSQSVAAADESATASDVAKGTPEILVKGRRSINADIERSEDAPQPYVIFTREEIQHSQAVTVEDFLRSRLPMNTTAASQGQDVGNGNGLSRINLRGLGVDETLILIDGRRTPGVSLSGSFGQPDLNGIPLSAIERIEVLPSTASGIYGGGATGGVINIIMRKDYVGVETSASYVNTFDTDTAQRRLDVSAGFGLEGGRTQVTVAASYSDGNNLTVRDRPFADRLLAHAVERDPSLLDNGPIPPLGATVNIRSTTDVLVLDDEYGGAILSENFTHIPLGYTGPDSDDGAALLTNAGRFNLELPAGLQGSGAGLVSSPALRSATLNVRRSFGEHLDVFVDASRFGNVGTSLTTGSLPDFITLPADAPNNPFQQDIYARAPFPRLSFENRWESTTMRVTGGLIGRLPADWTVGLEYGWGRSRVEQIGTSAIIDDVGACVLARGVAANFGANPCSADPGDSRPALNFLQEGNTFPLDFSPYQLPSSSQRIGPADSVMTSSTLRASGPLMRLPGGALTLAARIDRIEGEFRTAISQNIDAASTELTFTFFPRRTQNVDSYYVEATVPLVGAGNARPLLHELELQVSTRRDDYATRGAPNTLYSIPSREGPFPEVDTQRNEISSTKSTLALRYAPVESLALRASVGTGFLPPSVTQLTPAQSTYFFPVASDPKRGGTGQQFGLNYTYIYGGNPDLQPENSESWSAGVIFTPRFAPGFRLSVDYTRIDKVDEISFPSAQFILNHEDTLPGRVVRGDRMPSDPDTWAGVITSINTTALNIADTSLQAYDIQADYTVTTARLGEFRAYAVATHQPDYQYRLLPGNPLVDTVGFVDGPLEWRGNLGFTWSRGPLAMDWNTQYYDPYWVYYSTDAQPARDAAADYQGSARIPRQMYHDLIFSWRFDGGTGLAARWLAGSELSLGIRNLFDKEPPFVASQPGDGGVGYSGYGDPLLRRYSVNFRKSFH